MRTVLAIDHDAKACDVYRANVPGAQVVCGEEFDECTCDLDDYDDDSDDDE